MPTSRGTGIAGRIVSALEGRTGRRTAADVRIGLGYTAVALDGGGLGLAYTFGGRAGGCSAALPRPLAGRRAADLLALLAAGDPVEAAVGLACANALAGPPEGALGGDVLDHLDVGPEDDVAMVGWFGPLVPALRERARSLTVFERTPGRRGGLVEEGAAAAALPECSVALITATSLINHTADELLDAARPCGRVALLGASTPLLPEAFEGTAVTLLAGVVPRDTERVLEVVSEAGGMQAFSRHVDKVVVRVR
jgi:hypothetical protein